MPRFDGTGPVGRGPMSGFGRGNCVLPIGQVCQWVGRGLGRGFGRSLGWRARGFAEDNQGLSVGAELARLREQVADLQQALQQK